MKRSSGRVALAIAGTALLTTAAYAQTPPDALSSGAQSSGAQGAVHPRVHHSHSASDRHAYHTGTAHAAATHSRVAAYASDAAGGYVSQAQPLYDVYNAAAQPIIAQPGIACVGGRGIGYYPNPVAYDDSAATIESGGEFTIERGYPGCFTYLGE
jgi:hypothetical protein